MVNTPLPKIRRKTEVARFILAALRKPKDWLITWTFDHEPVIQRPADSWGYVIGRETAQRLVEEFNVPIACCRHA